MARDFLKGDMIRHRYNDELYLVLEDEEDLLVGCRVLHLASGRLTSVYPEMFVLVSTSPRGELDRVPDRDDPVLRGGEGHSSK